MKIINGVILALLGVLMIGCGGSVREMSGTAVRVMVGDARGGVREENPVGHKVLTERYERLLRRYVKADGRVDYKELSRQSETVPLLEAYVVSLGLRCDETVMTRETLAGWLNGYQACVLRAVLAFYPLEDWEDEQVSLEREVVFGFMPMELTLEEMRDYVVRYGGMRDAVYGLGRPYLGGPRLGRGCYEAGRLDEQLRDAKAGYVNSCGGVRFDHGGHKVLLGELLYQERDELREGYVEKLAEAYRVGAVPVGQVLMEWASDETQRRLAETLWYEVGRLPYDWRVNDLPRHSWFKRVNEKTRAEFGLSCGCD